MTFRHHLFPLAVLAALSAGQPFALAQHAPPEVQQNDAGLLELLPSDSTTAHVLKLSDATLPYTATAGTLELRGQDGKVSAKVFYTAYVAKDRPVNRPITFAFNGGPGAASAYLHLGLVGPRFLPFQGDNRDGTQPVLKDNPDSWLAFTDLVLIDAVGTGWSRATGKDTEGNFYGVRQDAESIAKVIALYSQQNARVGSPIYLLGESYGGFRAAKVATALKDTQGMLVSGIVMLSPLIEGEMIFNRGNRPLIAALRLPSIAAGALERKGGFNETAVRDAEKFAMGDYLTALAGPEPTGEQAQRLYSRIAGLTGIDVSDVTRTRGFIGNLYRKNLASEPDKIASPYDAGYLVDDPYPESTNPRGDDAVLDGYTRAYGAAFASYARNELKYETDLTYNLLNSDINRRWEWNDGGSRASADATDDLRNLLSVIPSLRILVAHGYSDVLTPYGVSRYVIDHLPRTLVDGRVSLDVYRGGHMFYTQPEEHRRFTSDVRTFFAGLKTN